MIALTPHPDGTVIAIKAQPGAKRNAILGERGDALRIAVTAAPEQGKANDAIGTILALALQIKASKVRLLTGATSRNKRFLIEGLTISELKIRLADLSLKAS